MPKPPLVHRGGLALDPDRDADVVGILNQKGPKLTTIPGIRDGGSQRWPIGSARVTSTLGQFPFCSLTLSPDFLKRELVQSATPHNLNLVEAYLQALYGRFEDREPCRIVMYGDTAARKENALTDRQKDVLVFDGLVSSYAVGSQARGNISVSLQLQHVFSLMHSIDFSIYSESPDFYLYKDEALSSMEDGEEWEPLWETPDSVAALIYGIVRGLLADAWNRGTENATQNEHFQALHAAQHDLNNRLTLAYLFPVLKASVETTRMPGLEFTNKQELVSAIRAHFVGASSIWKAVVGVMRMFYNYPVFPLTLDTERIPYFKRENFHEEASKKWSLVKENTRAGRHVRSGVPVVQVLVTGLESTIFWLVNPNEAQTAEAQETPQAHIEGVDFSEIYRLSTKGDDTPTGIDGKIYGAYPEKISRETLVTGTVRVIPPPFWASKDTFMFPEYKEPEDVTDPAQRLEAFQAWWEDFKALPGVSAEEVKSIERFHNFAANGALVAAGAYEGLATKAISLVAHDYLRRVLSWVAYMEFFREWHIGNTNGPLSMPLKLSYAIGERVTVQDGEQDLFDGFPSQVVHTVDLSGGAGSLSTAVAFDYVSYSVFTDQLSRQEKSLIDEGKNAAKLNFLERRDLDATVLDPTRIA